MSVIWLQERSVQLNERFASVLTTMAWNTRLNRRLKTTQIHWFDIVCLNYRLEFDVWSGFHDPETFFDLPHEARLAIVRTSRQGGRAFAELISHAVDHQLQNRAVSETEIWVSEPSGDLGCLSAT